MTDLSTLGNCVQFLQMVVSVLEESLMRVVLYL